MELHTYSHQFTHRPPDWRAAVLAGVTAGAAFLLLGIMLMALVTGASPLDPPRMIAAITLGRGVLQSSESYSVGIVIAAFAVHFALAIVLALILSLIMASFSFDSSVGMASVVGGAFGLAVYLVNFYGMTRFFPGFADARNWASAVAHIVFGAVAADMYMRLERKASVAGKADSSGHS